MFDLLLEEGMKLLHNSIEIKFKNCENALDKLKAIIMIQIKSIIKYTDFATVVINNTIGETSRTKKCRKAVNDYAEVVKKVLEEGMSQGIFYEGDAEGIAYGIVGACFSSMLYRIKKDGNVTAEQIYKSYVETVIRGITKI